MPFLVRMIINTAAILLIAHLLPSIMKADGFLAALAAAFVLGIVNAVVRPVFVLLTLPITIFTLGIFLLVINGLLLLLVGWLVPGFHVHGLFGAIVGSILISLIAWILSWVVP